ncbi:GFA family protein [Paracoccus versutus]|uniref:GFA family protein n=1 Tax=Paracoccus versutus TaxID=34007 RepID=UPI000DF7968A|nr:GFA family protein [Paracoccus versutus]RDD70336.1 GFA family protein [Paracoccus versutus]
MKVDGRCHCGHVTYQAEIDPGRVSICHCTDCQQLAGSAFRVTATVPREAFRLTGTAPRCSVKVADNGKRRRQFFCPECGSPICTTGEGAETEEIGIRVGTVNPRDQLTPTSQIWCGSALPWLGEILDLPGRPRD